MANWDVWINDIEAFSHQEKAQLNAMIAERETEVNARVTGGYDMRLMGRTSEDSITHLSPDDMDETFNDLVHVFPAHSFYCRCDNGVPMQVRLGNRSSWQGESVLRKHNYDGV
jgi:hypothetical protein